MKTEADDVYRGIEGTNLTGREGKGKGSQLWGNMLKYITELYEYVFM